MRTAEQWSAQLQRENRMEVSQNTIERIQAETLAAAAEICLKVARRRVDNDAPDCAEAIIAEAEKLIL